MSLAVRTIKSTYAAGIIVASLLAGMYLAACGGNGTGSGNLPKSGVAGHKIAPVAIASFADDPGNIGIQVVVTSSNTLTAGALIVISGTTNYDGTYAVVSSTGTSFTITKAFVANDATGVWQTGGGVIAGCLTTGATGAIALSSVASRFTGVAPLGVFFDATTTTATATTRPFHDLEYQWNFGDPLGSPVSGTTWANGSRAGSSSRNTATGPVASHVYETAGTYDVTLTITDGANTVTNACVRIAVQDPEVIFAGPNTICFSNGPVDFTGCPAGATQVQPPAAEASNFRTALQTHAAPGRRLLFRGGNTFTVSTAAELLVNGPGIIGSYGGGKAILQSTEVSAFPKILSFSSPGTPNLADWRVMDLDFDGQLNAALIGIQGSAGFDQLTLLRLDVHDIGGGIVFPSNRINGANSSLNTPHHVWGQLAIVDSTMKKMMGGVQGAFLSGTRMSFMGNLVDDTLLGEHPVRVAYARRFVFSNNTLRGAPGLGALVGSKETLTIRAPNSFNCLPTPGCSFQPNAFPPPGVAGAPGEAVSGMTVVSDNQFVTNGYEAVGVNQVANTDDTRHRDYIFERNWYNALPGSTTGTALEIHADEVTVRNEIIDMTNFTGRTGIQVQGATGMPASSNVRLYNNSIYTADAGSFFGIRMEPGVTNVTIQNNLAFAPNATVALGFVMISNAIGNAPPTTCPVDGTGETCNSGGAQLKSTSPGWTITSPMVLTNFKPGLGSYAIDRGVQTPVFADFFPAPRAMPFDLGAVNP